MMLLNKEQLNTTTQRPGCAVVARQSQAEANAYWADKDYKKWVVGFTAGSRRNRRTAQALVGASTASGARRAGIACMQEQGQTWVRSAAATVRLATAQDLGCMYTGSEKGGAA